MSPCRNRCWTHNCPKPCLLQMPIAAEASARILMAVSMPRYRRTLCILKPSLAPLRMPDNSASPELRAIIRRVLLQCVRRCRPRNMHPPDVDFRVWTQPAKSEPTKVSSSRSLCRGYFYTSRGLCSKYRAMRRRACHAFSCGWSMCLQHSLAAKARSGRSSAR